MKIAAIIAEYNPFHNGHLYHVEKTRELHGADNIICVMSGNFVQRGEPAIADKWRRAEMALRSGVDIVLELPFLFSVQSAEGFAHGATHILDALNCVDMLSFGADTANVALLDEYAGMLASESRRLKEALQKNIKKGLSYPAARQAALDHILGTDGGHILRGSNNILAIEYLKSLRRSVSPIKPVAIQRLGNSYNDTDIQSNYSSATAIRAEIGQHGFSGMAMGNIPQQTHDLYDFIPTNDTQYYFRLLQYKLRTMTLHEISEICDVTEGLEHRIKRASADAKTLLGLVSAIKSKRYTYTRICRILLYCLFDVTKKKIRLANSKYPLYARLLGFRKESEAVLSHIAGQTTIPLITRHNDFIESPLLEYDVMASDVYALLTRPILPAGRDFTQKLIIV